MTTARINDIKKTSDGEELDDWSPPLEGDEEEVKEGKRLEILTSSKLFSLPVLLAQIKHENNWCKLKNEIRKILYPLYWG